MKQAELYNDWEERFNFQVAKNNQQRKIVQRLIKQVSDYDLLYHRTNEMLGYLTGEGEIHAQHNTVEKVMDALFTIDGGTYDPELKRG